MTHLHLSGNQTALFVCVCVSIRPAAQRIWAAGWVCCLQRPAAPLSQKSYTTTTSTWIRSLTYGTLPDTPSCESLPTVYVCLFLHAFIWSFLFLIMAFFPWNTSVSASLFFSSQMGHYHCCFLQQCLDRLQNIWRGLWKHCGEETLCDPVMKYNLIKLGAAKAFGLNLPLYSHHWSSLLPVMFSCRFI